MSIPPPENNYPPQTPPYSDPSGITQDDKTMAMLAYLLGIFTGFVGPLVLWLIKKDQSKFVAFHAFQALLLHAVVVIGYVLSSLLVFVFIGFLTYPSFFALGLVFSIIAGLAANRGEWYDIPVLGPFARQQTGN
jgi:uncharacterized membrane protein